MGRQIYRESRLTGYRYPGRGCKNPAQTTRQILAIREGRNLLMQSLDCLVYRVAVIGIEPERRHEILHQDELTGDHRISS